MPTLSGTVRRTREAMSIKFNTMVYEMRRRGEPVIVLSLGEAFFDLPPAPMDTLPVPDVYHYSHSRGLPELRSVLADHYQRDLGVPVNAEREILVTAGSKAAIHFSFMAMLDPGDEVVVPEPAWVSYPEQIRLCGGVPVSVPHDIPTGDLGAFVTSRTRAVIINNPQNPTGRVYTPAELVGLVDLCRARDLHLLVDEVYSDFAVDGGFHSAGRIDPDKDHVVICNSISKNLGLSGWRIGYVIARPSFIDAVLRINQHVITCAPTILQHHVARHFGTILETTAPQIRALADRRRAVAARLDDLGLRHLPGETTFYFFVATDPSRLGSEDFCLRLLRDHRVSAVPGIGYGESCDRFIRLSVATESMENIHIALGRIRSLIDATATTALPIPAIRVPVSAVPA